MFERKFQKFDFRGFVDFIYEFVDKYGMHEIRFYPERRELFSESQLTHVVPYRSASSQDGFAWAWKQKQDEVRKVSFDLFARAGSPKVTMTINLDKKLISLDKIDGISAIQFEEVIKNNLNISDSWFGQFQNSIKKHLPEILIGIIVTVIGGIILSLIL